MKFVIQQYQLTFILFLSLLITSCKTDSATHLKSYPKKTLLLDGHKIEIFVADTGKRQKEGLSKIQSKDFSVNQGMLFPEDGMRLRQFWMPETHFDLDVFFMNEDYYVLDIHRQLKHFPKEGPKKQIPLSKEVFSQHVLELRSDSPHAAKIKPGMILKFE